MEYTISSDQIQKYIRLAGNEIIIFSMQLQHSFFKQFNPISAGSCIIDANKLKVFCFGVSISLDLKSEEKEDTRLATLQIFGQKKS